MSERRAVVIGINDYEDKSFVPHLKGAENDAREVFARLQKFGLDFKLDKAKHLLLGEKAKCDDIRRAISDLFWNKKKCDMAVFYFSGHGFLDDYGNGYIAPWDHEYRNPLVRGIRMQELRQYFLAENNKAQSLLILDCCHSGVAAEGVKGNGEVKLSGRFYDSLTSNQAAVIGEGKFILASSGKDETSREMFAAHGIRVLDKKDDELEFDDLDEHDHGVMTYHLLEGMNGGAAEGEEVKIGKLFQYVSNEIHKYQNKDNSRKDFTIYDCVCSTYEKGGASETVLVKASGKSVVDKLIQEAENNFSDIINVPKWDPEHTASDRFPAEVVFPSSIDKAIRSTDDALSRSPENPEVKKLVSMIDAKLIEYQGYVDKWLLRERGPYTTRSFRDEYTLLSPVVTKLCFERLRKLEDEQRTLVMLLIEFALGRPVKEDFESALKQGPFTRAHNKEGLASAVVVAGGSIQ